MTESDRTRVLRSQGKRLVVWLVALAIVALTVSLLFLTSPYQGPDSAADRLDSEAGLSVASTDSGYIIDPSGESEGGLVFYPGARVAPNAYLDSLAPLAREANVTVVVPRMPLNLAIVDYGLARTPLADDAAAEAIAARPGIDRWYVGGHSLGGVVACRYAEENTDRIDGVVLYASYCDRDISGTGLAVLSVVGAGDTVLNRAAYRRSLDRLPEGATTAELPGLNHTQFGNYTGQRGDTPTGTGYDVAHARLNEVAIAWFEEELGTR